MLCQSICVSLCYCIVTFLNFCIKLLYSVKYYSLFISICKIYAFKQYIEKNMRPNDRSILKSTHTPVSTQSFRPIVFCLFHICIHKQIAKFELISIEIIKRWLCLPLKLYFLFSWQMLLQIRVNQIKKL